MRTAIVDDIHAAAAMADNLLAGGVSVFKAVLIRETGQYAVSWEMEDDVAQLPARQKTVPAHD